MVKDVIYSDHRQTWVLIIADHCVCLATASGSICEDTSVEAIRDLGNELLTCVLVDFMLRSVLEDFVKEVPLFLGSVQDIRLQTIVLCFDLHSVKDDEEFVFYREDVHFFVLNFLLGKRSDPDSHKHVCVRVFFSQETLGFLGCFPFLRLAGVPFHVIFT
jgi:hypothetical protein